MLNYVRIMLVGALMAVLMVFVPATANAAPIGEVISCQLKYRWQSDHWNDGTVGADEWWIKAKHYYHFCAVSGGDDYVVPLKSVYSYNFEGTSQNCNAGGALNTMLHIDFTSHFWDSVGHSLSPEKVVIKCSETSTKSRVQWFGVKRKLYIHDSVPVKFKTNWELVRTSFLSYHHHYGHMVGYLRKCNGRGVSAC